MYSFLCGDFESVQKAVALSIIFRGAKILQFKQNTKQMYHFLNFIIVAARAATAIITKK